MPHILLHPPPPSRPLSIYYRRTLHRSPAWHAVELADGRVLVLRRAGARRHAVLTADAAPGFRKRLYAALAVDRRGRVTNRADAVCEEAPTEGG